VRRMGARTAPSLTRSGGDLRESAIREAALLRVSAAAQLADYLCETTELWSVIGSAATAPDRFGGGEFPALVPGESTWQRAFAESQPAGPQRILLRRLHEISVGISYAPRPLLMAAPTSPKSPITALE